MHLVGDDLKAFIESGVAVLMATVSADGRPHGVLAWGPRIEGGGNLLRVFIENSTGEATLSDLADGGRVAVTVGSPVSYRSLQVKGPSRGLVSASAEDDEWILRHRQAFAVETALVGDPPNLIRNLWRDGGSYTGVLVEIEAMFDQTPGPDAGKPL